jgi:hypothetical protein
MTATFSAAPASFMDRIQARTREEDEDNVPMDGDPVIDALLRLACREKQFSHSQRERLKSLTEAYERQSREATANAENAEARLKRALEALDSRKI